MAWKVRIFADGDEWVEEPKFDTEKAAEAYGCDCMGAMATGAEIMELNPNLGNPCENYTFEVFEK